jgi:hypothetical protein
MKISTKIEAVCDFVEWTGRETAIAPSHNPETLREATPAPACEPGVPPRLPTPWRSRWR